MPFTIKSSQPQDSMVSSYYKSIYKNTATFLSFSCVLIYYYGIFTAETMYVFFISVSLSSSRVLNLSHIIILCFSTCMYSNCTMLLCSFETTCYFVLVLKLYNMFKPSFFQEVKNPRNQVFCFFEISLQTHPPHLLP